MLPASDDPELEALLTPLIAEADAVLPLDTEVELLAASVLPAEDVIATEYEALEALAATLLSLEVGNDVETVS